MPTTGGRPGSDILTRPPLAHAVRDQRLPAAHRRRPVVLLGRHPHARSRPRSPSSRRRTSTRRPSTPPIPTRSSAPRTSRPVAHAGHAAPGRRDRLPRGEPSSSSSVTRCPPGLLGPQAQGAPSALPYVVFLGGAEVTLPGAVPGVNNLLRHVLGNASMLLTVSEYTARAAAQQVHGRVPAEVLRPPLPVDEFAPATADEAAALKRRAGHRRRAGGLRRPARAAQGPGQAHRRPRPAAPGVPAGCTSRSSARAAWRPASTTAPGSAGSASACTSPGALADSAVKDWLRAADLFASPCRTRWGGFEVEGFGIVFAEAALAGLPVVAGRSGGAPEAVLEGQTGTVVDGRSAAAGGGRARLASCVCRPSGAARWAPRGRELAIARHAPAAVGERYRELLRRAAAAVSEQPVGARPPSAPAAPSPRRRSARAARRRASRRGAATPKALARAPTSCRASRGCSWAWPSGSAWASPSSSSSTRTSPPRSRRPSGPPSSPSTCCSRSPARSS